MLDLVQLREINFFLHRVVLTPLFCSHSTATASASTAVSTEFAVARAASRSTAVVYGLDDDDEDDVGDEDDDDAWEVSGVRLSMPLRLSQRVSRCPRLFTFSSNNSHLLCSLYVKKKAVF